MRSRPPIPPPTDWQAHTKTHVVMGRQPNGITGIIQVTTGKPSWHPDQPWRHPWVRRHPGVLWSFMRHPSTAVRRQVRQSLRHGLFLMLGLGFAFGLALADLSMGWQALGAVTVCYVTAMMMRLDHKFWQLVDLQHNSVDFLAFAHNWHEARQRAWMAKYLDIRVPEATAPVRRRRL